jgi:hypothetical protein
VSAPPETDRSGCTYRVFSFRGRPVVSLPATGAGRRAGLRCYQPTTLPRRAFRAGIVLASVLGADRWLARDQVSPLPPAVDPKLARWLTGALRQRGAVDEGIVVMWPRQPDRGRIYVHASDSRGHPVAFVKIALDDRNRRLMAREVATLTELVRETPSRFRVPRVLLTREVAGSLAVIGEPLPAGAASPTLRRAVLPAAAVAEYSGLVRTATDVTTTSWWPSYRRALTPPLSRFDDELLRLTAGGVRTVRAHGDLSAHNMALVGGRLWLLDWEESAPDAPVLTDRVGFTLSKLSRRLTAKPAGWRDCLGPAGTAGLDGAARVDLMLALAFRHARGFADARTILRHWNRSAGWGVQ